MRGGAARRFASDRQFHRGIQAEATWPVISGKATHYQRLAESRSWPAGFFAESRESSLRKPPRRKPCVDASRCARKILTFLTCDRVRSCVRPLCAAFHMPRAGMEIRGSGPNQLRRAQVGALASPGFPDPDLIDHLPMLVIAFLTLPGGRLWQGCFIPPP